VVLLALGPSPAYATPLGEPLDEAVAVQVTKGGLDRIGEIVSGLVPPAIPVEGSSSQFECSADDLQPLDYSLASMDLLLSVDAVEVIPSEGRLDIDLFATLSSTQTSLTVSGDCSVLTDLEETCSMELPTTAVSFSLGMYIYEYDGSFQVTEDQVELAISPIGNPLESCTLASAIGTMLGQDESAISTLLLDAIGDSLTDLGPELALSFEDALNSLNLETELALGDAVVDLALYPSLIDLSESGILIGVGAAVDVDTSASCVDPGEGSDTVGIGWPDFAATASGTTLEPDIALHLGKDFLDHLLYATWAGGLLCLDASSLFEGGLTAGTLGSLLGEDFQELFADDAPVELNIDPLNPPVVGFEHDNPPIYLAIDDLQLDLNAELDHRIVRVLQVGVDADIGLDVGIEDGVFGAEFIFEDTDASYTEQYSELLPPGYSQGLGSLMGTMLGGLLPSDSLPSFTIPSLMGAEIEALTWTPSEDGQWQSGNVLIDTSGVEPVELAGCGIDALGCDGESSGLELELGDVLGCDSDAGCEGGCAVSGSASHSRRVRAARGRLILLLGIFAGLGLRRRS
jgi:hypothetical protein